MSRAVWCGWLCAGVLSAAACGGAEASERSAPVPPHARGIVWARSHGRECHREAPYHGACQGPRRVPLSRGPAAVRAHALHLGAPAAATHSLSERPPPEWIATVPGPPQDTLLWPVDGGQFLRGFGYVRRHLALRHDGIDILAPQGKNILAAMDGLVAYADNRIQGYGNLLVLVHADGTSTLYAHCYRIFVAPGELVRRGQVVAEVGRTGIARANHLHFEWHRDGQPIDPSPHMVGGPPH